MNIFHEYIDSGRIKSLLDLKKCYWSIIKKIHPDISRSMTSGELFIRIKADYDKMAMILVNKSNEGQSINHLSKKKTKVSKEMIINGFIEIAESGFPVDIRIRSESKLYVKRIAEYANLVDSYKIPGVVNFKDVEDELYKIRGDDIIDNPLFGKIRLIFYNYCSYYYEPKEHAKRAIKKWTKEIDEELSEKGYKNLKAFLLWLMDNAIV